MDLGKSTGIVSSRESMAFQLTVPKKSSVVAVHVLAGEEGAEWTVKSSARIVKG
jgi:hypothetical protein